MGKTEPGKREREKYNGKDCEEESEARPQGEEDEADCHQARRQRPPQAGEARSSSGCTQGCSQGQGSSPRRLNSDRRFRKARPDRRPAASGRTVFRKAVGGDVSAPDLRVDLENLDRVQRRASLERRNYSSAHPAFSSRSTAKIPEFVDSSQHTRSKRRHFNGEISVWRQQNTGACSLCVCSK